jgi:hypothetical protein
MAVLAALLVVGGVAVAKGIAGSIPGDDGTIIGCFKDHKDDKEKKGDLRVVSDADLCKKGETAIA